MPLPLPALPWQTIYVKISNKYNTLPDNYGSSSNNYAAPDDYFSGDFVVDKQNLVVR